MVHTSNDCAAYNLRLLKRRVGNGKVFLRPVQRDLSVEPGGQEDGEETGGVSAQTSMSMQITMS